MWSAGHDLEEKTHLPQVVVTIQAEIRRGGKPAIITKNNMIELKKIRNRIGENEGKEFNI